MKVDAKAVLEPETTPTKDGVRLAQHVLKKGTSEHVALLEIDVSAVAPEILVSGFVNALLHTLDSAGVVVGKQCEIAWVARFKSEARHLDELVRFYIDARGGASGIA